MFWQLWRFVISREMIAPAVIGAFSGVLIVLLVLVLRAPREVVVIEVDPAPDPNLIDVSVSGEVQRPGSYRIPRGSTAGDAVAAAGGFTAAADTSIVSASAELEHGDLLQVPARSERDDEPSEAMVANDPAPININTAGVDELDVLPGIGPVLAQRIVDYRAQFGPFQSVDELAAVSGISERMVEDLRSLVMVSG